MNGADALLRSLEAARLVSVVNEMMDSLVTMGQ